jgi:Bacterial extracellular solute-binding protein
MGIDAGDDVGQGQAHRRHVHGEQPVAGPALPEPRRHRHGRVGQGHDVGRSVCSQVLCRGIVHSCRSRFRQPRQRAGAPKPDIGSSDALKRSVLAAKSVAYSAGASGIYMASMFQKLGISDEVKSKTAQVKPGEPVGEVVARGEAEIGFQQVSELIHVKGIDYLGALPAELQHITVFSG